MRARFWIGSLFVLSLIIGCSKSGPTPAPKPVASVSTEKPAEQEAPPIQPEPLPVLAATDTDSTEDPSKKSAAADMPPPDEGEEPEFSPKREAELLAKLEKTPKDADLLIAVAKLMQLKAELTETGDADYGLYKQSAEYLRRALEADPKIAESDDFLEVAAVYFFNDARALSIDKQEAAGLKSLKMAIDFGLRDIPLMKSDEDLEFLRKSQEYAPLLELTLEKRKAEIATLVDTLFAEKHDFPFNFELKDTEGKPLTKQEFEGKLLMVNLWGTWCGPCREEIPDLAAAYKKYKDQGLEVVGLNDENETGDEANATINESRKELGINYRCALGSAEIFEQIPGYEGTVPTTLFFDRQGKVRAKLTGIANELLLEVIIERLLKESPSAVTSSATRN